MKYCYTTPPMCNVNSQISAVLILIDLHHKFHNRQPQMFSAAITPSNLDKLVIPFLVRMFVSDYSQSPIKLVVSQATNKVIQVSDRIVVSISACQ
jgi:hypothetical protein